MPEGSAASDVSHDRELFYGTTAPTGLLARWIETKSEPARAIQWDLKCLPWSLQLGIGDSRCLF